MKLKYIYLACFILLGFSIKMNAQDNGIVEVEGRLLDIVTQQPMQFAHITNLQKKLSTVSNKDGYFKIIMIKTDSLRITSIGFENIIYTLPFEYSERIIQPVLYMEEKDFEIATVDIYRLRYEAFKYDFMRQEVVKPYEQERLEEIINNLIPFSELQLYSLMHSSKGIPLNFKSKRDKSVEKLLVIEKQDMMEKRYNDRFSDSLINKITGLKGDEIVDFKKFCRIDRNFVLSANDYDLITRIKTFNELYKRRRK